MTALGAAAERGTLVYGECGGFMTLGEGLTDADGHRFGMAGLLPLETSFEDRRLHLGYRCLRPVDAGPFVGDMRGHEFHYATTLSQGDAPALFVASDAAGGTERPMGLRVGRVMGSFAHIIDVDGSR